VARRSRSSSFRDFYVWADEPPADPKTGVVFPDAEDSIWSFDDKAGQWYLHYFYLHAVDDADDAAVLLLVRVVSRPGLSERRADRP
jgi:glycosidase